MDAYRRPSRWSEGEGHFAIEIVGHAGGRGGQADARRRRKAKRPVAAILRYLTLLMDDILEAFPAGTVPPIEEVTLRSAAEMEPLSARAAEPRLEDRVRAADDWAAEAITFALKPKTPKELAIPFGACVLAGKKPQGWERSA